MTEEQARDEIERADRERAQFVDRYFRKEVNDPVEYDLVLNMEYFTHEAGVRTALGALRARGWSMEVTGGDKRQA